MLKDLQAIILAAGKSRRFISNHSKLVEKICGQEVILYTTKLFDKLSVPMTVVIGHEKELIQLTINMHHENVKYIEQKEQLGTGHAVSCTKANWEKKDIIIINSDTPLITSEIIESLYKKHIEENAKLTFVISQNPDPSNNSYGIVVKEDNEIKIVEAKDNFQKKEANWINAGIYIVSKDFLEEAIPKLEKSKVTGELYITDLVKIASENGYKVETVSAPFNLIRGINTLQELAICEQIKRTELIKYWTEKGIKFSMPTNTHIDLNVTIEAGTVVGPYAQLYGLTKIGKDCKIGAFCILDNAIIEENVHIEPYTMIKKSLIKKNKTVGPLKYISFENVNSENFVKGNFADIQAQVNIKNNEIIGDFNSENYMCTALDNKNSTDFKLKETVNLDNNGSIILLLLLTNYFLKK